MKQRHAAVMAVALVLLGPCKGLAEGGATIYSDKSLLLLCSSNNAYDRATCDSYIRGVVETWLLKDVVGPDQYESHEGTTFCDRILKVSVDEWVSIVRRNLKSLKPGFASGEVMRLIHDALCN